MDIVEQLGELALATRLKRLSERLQRDVSLVYRELDVDFQARWFAPLYALGKESPQAITDLARMLGLSHPAVNQIAGQMIRNGLLQETRDRRDERRRLLRLSAKGRRLLKQLEPVWQEIRMANAELLEETGVDLLSDLARIEAALAARSMAERVRRRLGLQPAARLHIVDYRPAYKKHFAVLNRRWLQQYFTLEESDVQLLSDPNGKILKQGGAVLFALLDGEVVGTAALLRHGEAAWELAKMAVAPPARGRGIGETLARAIITRAGVQGARQLFLQTSPKLTAAGRLYRKLGFRRVKRHPLPGDAYHRCTITMRLDLAKYGQEQSTRIIHEGATADG
jgi:DNA-binding MarR family transcriptional regulator/N-acetylglutamate synthase-like GNAT family acetyltransferase